MKLPALHATTYQCSDGLTLYVHRNPKTPLSCIEICIQSGSLHEHKTGQANLMLACLLKGSQTLSHTDFSQALESLGGSLSLRCTPSAQYIRIEVLSHYAAKAFALVWSALQTPAFLPSEIKKEKELIASQLKNAKESPAYLAQCAFLTQIYGPVAPALMVDGTPQSLQQLTQEDLFAYHQTHFQPSNMVIAISSDQPDFILSTLSSPLERAYHPKTHTLNLPDFSSVTPAVQGPYQHITTPDKDQCVVLMGHLGISRLHSDFMSMLVLDVLLGQGPGFSSRLPQVLRDQQGLVYHLSFSGTQNAHLYPGLVQTYLECSPHKVKTCLELVNQELHKVCETPISTTELSTIQNYLKGQLYFCFETNAQRCSYFLHRHIFGWHENHLAEYITQLQAITPQQLKAVAAKHFQFQNQTLVTAGPEPHLSGDAIPC